MSIMISQYVMPALLGNIRLRAAVKDRIHRTVIPNDGAARYPYIVVSFAGMSEAETKDGVYGDVNTVDIGVFAKSADQLTNTAQLVRDAMRDGYYNASDVFFSQDYPFELCGQSLTVGPEVYDQDHDGFYIQLTYSIETEDI